MGLFLLPWGHPSPPRPPPGDTPAGAGSPREGSGVGPLPLPPGNTAGRPDETRPPHRSRPRGLPLPPRSAPSAPRPARTPGGLHPHAAPLPSMLSGLLSRLTERAEEPRTDAIPPAERRRRVRGGRAAAPLTAEASAA